MGLGKINFFSSQMLFFLISEENLNIRTDEWDLNVRIVEQQKYFLFGSLKRFIGFFFDDMKDKPVWKRKTLASTSSLSFIRFHTSQPTACS